MLLFKNVSFRGLVLVCDSGSRCLKLRLSSPSEPGVTVAHLVAKSQCVLDVGAFDVVEDDAYRGEREVPQGGARGAHRGQSMQSPL